MNHNPKKWDFDKPKDFREQVLKLPKEVRPRLTEVMTLLSESDNPLALGKKKITKRGEIYAIRLSDFTDYLIISCILRHEKLTYIE